MDRYVPSVNAYELWDGSRISEEHHVLTCHNGYRIVVVDRQENRDQMIWTVTIVKDERSIQENK